MSDFIFSLKIVIVPTRRVARIWNLSNLMNALKKPSSVNHRGPKPRQNSSPHRPVLNIKKCHLYAYSPSSLSEPRFLEQLKSIIVSSISVCTQLEGWASEKHKPFTWPQTNGRQNTQTKKESSIPDQWQLHRHPEGPYITINGHGIIHLATFFYSAKISMVGIWNLIQTLHFELEKGQN